MVFQRIAGINFSNCVIHQSSRGIGLYSTKGSIVENVNCSNITCNTAAPLVLNRPIHLSVWNKSRGKAIVTEPSVMRNITIDNFTCTTDGRILLAAEDGCTLENVTLKNIKMNYAFIEDPQAIAPGHKSEQGSPKCPKARAARAAIVAENVDNLEIDGVQISWPTDEIPEEFKIPKRIENGTNRAFYYDYTNPRQTELSVLWTSNVTGSFNGKLVNASSSETPKFLLAKSKIDIQ